MSRTDYSAVADAEEICRHKLPSLSPATLQYPMGNCQQQNPPSSLPPTSQTHIQTDLLSGLKRAVEASRSRCSGCWLQIRGWMGEMALLRPPLFVLLRRTTDDCKTCFAIRFLSLSRRRKILLMTNISCTILSSNGKDGLHGLSFLLFSPWGRVHATSSSSFS